MHCLLPVGNQKRDRKLLQQSLRSQQTAFEALAHHKMFPIRFREFHGCRSKIATKLEVPSRRSHRHVFAARTERQHIADKVEQAGVDVGPRRLCNRVRVADRRFIFFRDFAPFRRYVGPWMSKPAALATGRRQKLRVDTPQVNRIALVHDLV